MHDELNRYQERTFENSKRIKELIIKKDEEKEKKRKERDDKFLELKKKWKKINYY